MSQNRISYGDLDRFLHGLGFQRQVVERHRLVYEHPESKTLIVLADRGKSAPLREADVVSVQKQLLDHGLASQDDLTFFSQSAKRPTA
jgi:hypothetical protein